MRNFSWRHSTLNALAYHPVGWQHAELELTQHASAGLTMKIRQAVYL